MNPKSAEVDAGLPRRAGTLTLDEVSLADIAERFGTPCYVYSQQRIEQAYDQYQQALGLGGRIHYAVKANPAHAILQTLARHGAGFDIVSAGEMARVVAAGGDTSAIVFSGVGKQDQELHAALLAGIGCFNIESSSELERLNRIAIDSQMPARVALRINPDVVANTHRHIATGAGDHKFGIAPAKARLLAQQVHQSTGLQLRGLAMHIGSQIKQLQPMLQATRRLLALADELCESGIEITELDLGGGLGVGSDAPTIPDYVSALLSEVDGRYTVSLEPGRSVVADAGLLLTRVICTKRSGDRHFAVVDAGMNDFLRPALYDARHATVNVDLPGQTEVYDVAGPVCETADTLAWGQSLDAREGALLAILSVGAYGATMSSHYNSRPRCAEVMTSNGRFRLIRARETIAEMIEKETATLTGESNDCQ